jgi:KaiC/GvpD/RAD55 family RecA-like ATPase/PKD repeat protein
MGHAVDAVILVLTLFTVCCLLSPVAAANLSVSISPSQAVIDVGQAQLFTSNVTGGKSPYSYQWYLEGVPVSGATNEVWTFSPTGAGSYTVYVVVTDSAHARVQSDPVLVTVNSALSVLISPSSVVLEVGQSQLFNSTISGETSLCSYQWYIDGSPVSDGTGTTWTFTASSSGYYDVYVTLTDNVDPTARSNIAMVTVNPALSSPVAQFTESARTVETGTFVQFNASNSYDPNGTITTYFWDFGDQTNATGVVVSHKYVQYGNYTVTLTVTDNDGSSNSTSINETIINSALSSPVAQFTESARTVETGTFVQFNASNSYDPNGTITTYFWDFGDQTNATGVVVSHKYVQYGNYTVTLTVTDNDGSSNSTSINEAIVNSSTIASFTILPTQPSLGDLITFNASSSYDLNGTIESYMWDFGDGNTTETSASIIAHFYTLPGDYNVTLTIFNSQGDNASTSQRISLRALNSGASTWGFDWKWALLIAPAAVLVSAGFVWKKRNGVKKFRSFEYFDEITNGGIPDSFSVLITGGVGSGKSMLCQELTHAFLTQKKSCLYVTYDCFSDEVRGNLGKFHDEISTYEAEKKLLFMDCFSASSKNKDREYYLGQSFSLADLGIVLSEATNDLGPSPKIILDSITPLITHVDPLKVIEFLQERGARIKQVSGTFIFTMGKATIEPNLANRLEETVDCIIELDESTNKGKTVRRLRVKKMRGKETSDKWVRFEIEPNKGIIFQT